MGVKTFLGRTWVCRTIHCPGEPLPGIQQPTIASGPPPFFFLSYGKMAGVGKREMVGVCEREREHKLGVSFSWQAGGRKGTAGGAALLLLAQSSLSCTDSQAFTHQPPFEVRNGTFRQWGRGWGRLPLWLQNQEQPDKPSSRDPTLQQLCTTRSRVGS